MKTILISILSAFQLLSVNTNKLPHNEVNTYEVEAENNGDIYNIPVEGENKINYIELHGNPDGSSLTATVELIYTVY